MLSLRYEGWRPNSDGFQPSACIIIQISGMPESLIMPPNFPFSAYNTANLQLLALVLAMTSPFLRDVHHCQIQHFEQAVIGRKDRLGFRDFP